MFTKVTTLAFSLGNDVLGLGEGAKALSWTNLIEKALQPGPMGGMAALAASGFLAWKITQWQKDGDNKFDLTDLRYITVPLIDVGLFIVGVAMLILSFWK